MLKFAERPAGPELTVLGAGSEMQYGEPASAADRPITEMYLGVRAWAAWAPGRDRGLARLGSGSPTNLSVKCRVCWDHPARAAASPGQHPRPERLTRCLGLGRG